MRDPVKLRVRKYTCLFRIFPLTDRFAIIVYWRWSIEIIRSNFLLIVLIAAIKIPFAAIVSLLWKRIQIHSLNINFSIIARFRWTNWLDGNLNWTSDTYKYAKYFWKIKIRLIPKVGQHSVSPDVRRPRICAVITCSAMNYCTAKKPVFTQNLHEEPP